MSSLLVRGMVVARPRLDGKETNPMKQPIVARAMACLLLVGACGRPPGPSSRGTRSSTAALDESSPGEVIEWCVNPLGGGGDLPRCYACCYDDCSTDDPDPLVQLGASLCRTTCMHECDEMYNPGPDQPAAADDT
jgi:hypothetical protein